MHWLYGDRFHWLVPYWFSCCKSPISTTSLFGNIFFFKCFTANVSNLFIIKLHVSMVSYFVMYILPTSEPTGISYKYYFCYLEWITVTYVIHSTNHVILITTKPKELIGLLWVNNVPFKHTGEKISSTYWLRVNSVICFSMCLLSYVLSYIGNKFLTVIGLLQSFIFLCMLFFFLRACSYFGMKLYFQWLMRVGKWYWSF